MSAVFENVRFSYPSGVEALRGVSFEVPTGQRLAIVGQKGGQDHTGAPSERHLSAHLGLGVRGGRRDDRPGDRRTGGAGWLRVSEPRRADLRLDGGGRRRVRPRQPGLFGADEARSRAMAALETVGLAAEAGHAPAAPVAQRKRVALAGVLAMQTPIVVLDEPTTGQDAGERRWWRAWSRFLASAGRTRDGSPTT
ncbi:MAG: hypothetical protein R2703_13680 [Micropruina glycogenica]